MALDIQKPGPGPAMGGSAAPYGSRGVPFVDLHAQYLSIRAEIDAAIARVLASGQFVLGPEVAAFEREFADYIGVRESVCLNSGTAALQLALMAAGIEPGDEVLIPANTFFATAEAVIWARGVPVFVDVREDDANLDPDAIAEAITPRTRFVMPVDLYGQTARYDRILEIAERAKLTVIEDACQAHGAMMNGRKAGTFGTAAAFSFYPGKNLGAYGEGGAVTTDDPEIARRIRMLRDHGQSAKYRHAVVGHNYRLEALQGAVLGVKLRHLDRWNDARRKVAHAYHRAFTGLPVRFVSEIPNAHHVFHLLVARVEDRDAFQRFLHARGIQALIHYPVPLHLQEALVSRGKGPGSYPVAERLAREIVSLPIYPEMTPDDVALVAGAAAEFFGAPVRPGRAS